MSGAILDDEHSWGELVGFLRNELCCVKAFSYATLLSWALLFIGIALAFLIFRHRNMRRHVIRHLIHYALGVFVSGTLIYIIGFSTEGTGHNPLVLCLRSVIASMEMFLSESELIEVAPLMKENPYYMIAFSIIHFLAVCISAAFILHIIGIRCRSFIRMRLASQKDSDVFVFFDLSQESINLAKNIYREYTRHKDDNGPDTHADTDVKDKKRKCQIVNLAKNIYKEYTKRIHVHKNDNGTDTNAGTDVKDKNRKCQIIFVKTPMEESHIERFSFSHLLSFADNRNETIEELIEMEAFLTYSRKSVTIGMEDSEWHDTIGLKNLRRYLDKCTGAKHLFCLSPNEDNNISTAVELSNRHHKDMNYKVYCRAGHNSITESFAGTNLTFIDSAGLSVLELKKNVEYQPVSFVCPDTRTGVATRPFRSMIVGFGETGFEVLRFLYEFGAFVGKDGKENPFSCDIIDPKARQLQEELYLHCPALATEGNSHARPDCYMIFHEGTVESNRSTVVDLMKVVDYIVVCTNNDQENLSLGITLLNLAYKYRDASAKLSIFIGINDSNEFKKAEGIARYYNTCGKIDGASKCQYRFSITPFGSNERIYTYENIINDKLLDQAHRFFHEYNKVWGYTSHADTNYAEDWKDRRKEKTKSDVPEGLGLKNELTQKEFQDKANAWHIQTKLSLCGVHKCASYPDDDKEMAKARRQNLFDCISTVMDKLVRLTKEEIDKDKEERTDSYDFIQHQIEEYEKAHGIPQGEYQILLGNLAKCEHLRWDASNRMLGYRTPEHATGNQKNYLNKTLACMVPNEELHLNAELKDTIKYDYTTVMVSLDSKTTDKLKRT